jgi:hypothetical protein
MSSAPPSIPVSLWSDICPNCAYSLAGLPVPGICPECGRPYDQSVLVLHGYGRGTHESIATARRSRMVWIVLLSVLGFGAQFANFIFYYRQGLPYLFAAVAVFLAWALFRRTGTDHPGLVQVRLSQDGCAQYDDLSGPSALRELVFVYGWVAPAVGIVVLIVLLRANDPRDGIALFIVCLGIASAWLVGMLVVSRRTRRELKLVPERAIADVNKAFCRTIPWIKIGTASLTPVGTNAYRLVIAREAPFFSFVTPRHRNAVDAEIQCTSEQVDQIRELIRGWMKVSKQTAATSISTSKP